MTYIGALRQLNAQFASVLQRFKDALPRPLAKLLTMFCQQTGDSTMTTEEERSRQISAEFNEHMRAFALATRALAERMLAHLDEAKAMYDIRDAEKTPSTLLPPVPLIPVESLFVRQRKDDDDASTDTRL